MNGYDTDVYASTIEQAALLRAGRLTIEEQRRQVRTFLEENPSIRAKLADSFDKAYQRAITRERRETGFDRPGFPTSAPWTLEHVSDDEFFPE